MSRPDILSCVLSTMLTVHAPVFVRGRAISMAGMKEERGGEGGGVGGARGDGAVVEQVLDPVQHPARHSHEAYLPQQLRA